MRISTILLSVFLFANSSTSIAQSVVTKDSLSVKIKSDRMPKANIFNTWNIAGHIGLTYPNTDIAASDINASNVKRGLAFGLDLSKFISHSFALQIRAMHAKLSGVDSNKPALRYNTTVDYDLTLNAIFQLGNVSFLKRTPNLAIYGGIGFGFLHYSPHVSIDGGNTELNGIYSQYTQPFDTMNYQKTTDFVIPFTVGVKYRVAKHFSVNLEYSLRTTNSDKLDGFYKLLSEDDDYSYFNVGLTYHIGSKDKMVEWVNPLQTVYADLYDTKDKVDLLAKDTDQDGVADIFDREPETPPGNKVYGDGTSIDTDGDGVPDVSDAEPFSAKNAKVDAAGKEIDSDNDGIPDSKDMEPNTAKGNLVNTQGVTMPTGPGRKAGSSSVLAADGFLPSIFFALDDDKIDRKFNETLANIALVMRDNPDVNFRLIGNCDARAGVEYNQKLGKRRAEAVKKHLVSKYHIDASRLSTETLGKNDPITTNHNINRRVDFKVQD